MLAKGHILSDEDIRLLETEGMQQVWVTELEEGEIGEDEAVMAVAQAMCCGNVEIRLAAGGRANLFATADACVLIDDELLKQINVNPDDVKYVGISHFHADHTGQLGSLRNATLLIGKGDWDGINANPPMASANVKGFAEWIAEKRKVEPLSADKDVFEDGTVMMLRAPGHTPGHSILLVRLKEMGPVILSGDAVHFHENYDGEGVPVFNYDRAQTLASIQRVKQLEKNLKATLIIQHDPRDIGKLPAFPAAAK